ncbi:hypothetical protein [Rummeliibacillus pycnus]|uniref:hypothetical protein n=1 Tax=Rummeliibacillus pycnus TaxID=101070 RepID=UPI0037C8ACAF
MKKNNTLKIWFIAILLALVAENWFYPYSFLSFNKSVTHDEGNSVVQQYLQDLSDFKSIYIIEPESDITTDRIQYILQMYEQKWLISKKPVNMKFNELDIILIKVRENREILLDLAFRENYSPMAKQYLKESIQFCFELEEKIQELKNSYFNSRITLKRQYRNLHGEFISSFDMFVSFYKAYKDAR